MSDGVTILGSKGGPALRQPGAMPTSSVLHVGANPIVVDCGLGVTRSLVASGVDLRDLKTIFITHLHSDHLLELGPLVHTAWTTGTTKNITIYGPPGIRDYLKNFWQAMGFDNDIRVRDEDRPPIETMVNAHEIKPGKAIRIDDITVTALRVVHPPVTDCFALRFDWAKRGVTFSADTSYFPPLADFARGSDILVHEAMLAQGVEDIVRKTGLGDALRQHLFASHTLAEDVGRIAADADVKHLILNHLVPADDTRFDADHWKEQVRANYSGKISVGCDGLQVKFPETA